MKPEHYLNHSTFGLLYSLCWIKGDQALYTTLYAQRLFFIVTHQADGLSFESTSRQQAKIIVENRMRDLKRLMKTAEYSQLQQVFQQTFQ
jgi:PII interaction protein X